MKKILFVLTSLLVMAACNNSASKQDAEQPSEEQPTQEQLAEEQQSEEQAAQEQPTLTFADVAGIYDSYDEDGGNEYRICLLEDGTATWSVIGSLHYTEYTYTIKGNTVCMDVNDVDSEDECYDYDPEKKTLSNEQGAIYYLQDLNP